MRILVTGGAGFIGSALTAELASEGHQILCVDNLNTYYEPALKIDRLRMLGFEIGGEISEISMHEDYESRKYPLLKFRRVDICGQTEMEQLFGTFKPEVVVNLAAQAGVRYSIENPRAYVHTNVLGFVNLLECAAKYPVRHFVYASSSSVYGGNLKTPFSETDRVDSPISVYAATKKCDELLASVYNNLYGVPVTGLRFFTVYGSWGRPDMAPMLFAENICKGKPIKVFNYGDMQRDFTHISDIVKGISRVINDSDAASRGARVYNIGAGHPESLEDFISLLEENLGMRAIKEYMPMQAGDVPVTYADTTSLYTDFGYKPTVSLRDGIKEFIAWYKDYYKK